jgi:hypothetical protein
MVFPRRLHEVLVPHREYQSEIAYPDGELKKRTLCATDNALNVMVEAYLRRLNEHFPGNLTSNSQIGAL